MHEFALAQDIVQTISPLVSGDLEQISQINIDVGAFSGIVNDSLEFGLKILLNEKNNTGVKININQVKTLARCECGQEYEMKNILEHCPVCHSFNRKIISGMDVVINSIEVRE